MSFNGTGYSKTHGAVLQGSCWGTWTKWFSDYIVFGDARL